VRWIIEGVRAQEIRGEETCKYGGIVVRFELVHNHDTRIDPDEIERVNHPPLKQRANPRRLHVRRPVQDWMWW